MTDALLEIRDLHVSFRAKTDHPLEAVRGVDLDVAKGERVAIVGESGSGKSVTMLSLLGLLGPGAESTGSVRFAGEELLGAPAGRLRRLRGNRIGMIFQDPLTSLNPVHTVGHQLAEAVLAHHPRATRSAKIARRRVARVGVDHRHQPTIEVVSARAVRRDAPAGDDRDGARQ